MMVIRLSGNILIKPVSSIQSLDATAAAIASLGIKFANQLNPIIIPPPVMEETLRNERLLCVLFDFSIFFGDLFRG